jgi:hypothetical protein
LHKQIIPYKNTTRTYIKKINDIKRKRKREKEKEKKRERR